MGESIKVARVKINTGYILHIKAIDNAGNAGETLHMPLTFIFRDLNLFKEYQEASNFTDTGIAQTPGWNYVKIDWNPIEIAEDRSEIPDVCLVIDTSGSMDGNRIRIVREGGAALINKLFDYYPEIKVSIVTFESSVRTLIQSSNDRNALLRVVRSLDTGNMTNGGGGVRQGTNILLNSTQKNHVLITMTDGYSNRGPSPPGELKRAQDNGIKTISLMIDMYDDYQFRDYSDKMYYASSGSGELYNTIAYSLYQEIQDTMISRYSVYREQSGVNKYQLVKGEITEVNYGDGTATDKVGPSRPLVTLSETADRDGNIKMTLWAEDKGTSYEFYAKFVHPRTKDELYSNPVVQEVKTGIKGYAWTISDSATTDPGGTIRNVQFVFGKEYVGKWLHIRAIDYAGNWGEVCHIRLETSRFIPWEELNSRKELFCVQHGQTIPAREDGEHLNATVVAGSGKYTINEVVADPKTGDRIGTRFVEGTTMNVYGTQDIYSYSLGKYQISQDTPLTRPGKEGNATEKEAYILNYYALNNSLESAIQKAMYTTEISKGNVTWNWDTTPESEALVAEANAYAAYKRKGYEFSNIKLNTNVYMDEEYKDTIIGPFILKYEPQALKYGDKELYFCNIVGMKIYDQNNNVIAELDKNGNNTGKIQVEFIYTGTATATKRYEPLFKKEKYKYPVGYEEFYIKLKYNSSLDDVIQINKIDFIHNEYDVDAQYNVLVGTYNKIKWTPNGINRSDRDVLWCHEVDNGYKICMHNKTYAHIVGCYFYLTATVYNSYREIPSQKLIDVLWTKSGYKERVQTLIPGSGEMDPEYPLNENEFTNEEWRISMTFTGNIWNDGMEDQNNGIKENFEYGIEKVKIDLYKVDKNGNRTGRTYRTYSDSLGNYIFENIIRGIYEIEFVYNGQIYKTTKLLVNGTVADYKLDLTRQKYKNNSTSAETNSDRKEFNEAYEEIGGDKKAYGGRGEIKLIYEEDIKTSIIQTTDNGYTKENFEMYAKTVSDNIYYPISKRINIQEQKYIKIVDSENVNLGLAQRYTTDSSLKTDIYEVIFSIKGDKQRYIFSEKNIRDINSNIEKDEYIQEVNRADYNWKLDDILNKTTDEEIRKRILESLMSKELPIDKSVEELKTEAAKQSELEAYLDYIIVIRNAGEKDKVQIAELANYYSKDLVYLQEKYRDFDMNSWAQVKYDDVKEGENRNKTDKIEIKWIGESKYEAVTNPYKAEYNKIYTTGLDREDLRIQKGEFLEVHIVFKVDKDTADKIKLNENNAGKTSMTEINGYKTYYIQDGSVAGLIDIDSQPGNANPTEEKQYQEDDENKAPALKLKLAETANAGDSIDDGSTENNNINRDENGNIIGYGNVIEGNVWEDARTDENTLKLENNQIISDGIRQDEETLIQNVTVELIEYFKHPTDQSKDVELTIRTQNTRTVLSLSNSLNKDTKLGGGYSFINLPSGSYFTKFTYGDTEQLIAETNSGYTGNIYTGIDYQGISTADINANKELNRTYEDVEIMLVADISGSINTYENEQIKSKATTITNGIYDRLPGIKIGLVSFNNTAKVITNPQQNRNKILNAIKNLGSENETAIGYGIEAATNSYSKEAKEKIMIILTDSEETVQNIEQVIKTLETATDNNDIELISILTKNNYEIFGIPETVENKAEPRRGEVYSIYNVSEEVLLNNLYAKIEELSQLENRRSSAKDIEGDINTPGTRAYNINKYQVMGLKEAESADLLQIKNLEGEEKIAKIEAFAAENKMTAKSKTIIFRPNNIKTNQIHEINLALMERPRTKLEIETKIKSIQIILADNTELINTAKGISKNVNGLDKENIPITIYMDEEIMHGANLIVEYEVILKNKGEIDRLYNYLTGGSKSTVTTSAKLVFNYTSKNMLYRGNSTQWDNIEISDIKGMIVNEAEESIKENDLSIYKTEGFDIKLYPEGSPEVLNGTGESEATFILRLSKLITSQNENEDLTFTSSMEIVERENTAGRPSYTEKPGNYVPTPDKDETVMLELDSIKERKIIITKPWGENRSISYILVALATTTMLAGGILLIKRKKKE